MEQTEFRSSFEDFAASPQAPAWKTDLPEIATMFDRPKLPAWMQDLADAFQRFLEKYFTVKRGTSSFDMRTALVWGAVILVALLIGILIASLFMGRGGGRKGPAIEAVPLPPEKRARLLALVAKAEADRNWGEAARLAWKIFLLERGLPESITPRMLRVHHRQQARLEEGDEAIAYEVMFSERREETKYRAFRERLAQSPAGAP